MRKDCTPLRPESTLIVKHTRKERKQKKKF